MFARTQWKFRFYLFIQVKNVSPLIKSLRVISNKTALIGIHKTSKTSNSYTTAKNHM